MNINMDAWYMKYFNFYKSFFEEKKEINLCCLVWSYLISILAILLFFLIVGGLFTDILSKKGFHLSIFETPIDFVNEFILLFFIISGIIFFIIVIPNICYWISEKIYKKWGFRTCPVYQLENLSAEERK